VKLFITGGSRGIGEAIVMEAARAGHDVAFTYREARASADRVLAAARDVGRGARIEAYALDQRSPQAVEEVTDRVLDDFGTIQGVVCNAGVNINGLAASLGDDEWQTVIDTNLSGSFYVCRQLLPSMVKARKGRIVMISSLGRGGVTGQAAYAASKAGLLGLSSTLAKEYGRKGITSNVVVPGFFETDMTREGMSDANKKFWLEYCPVGRMGHLSEVASVVMFLLSDGASYVNGESIAVTGGLDWAP